MTWSKVAESPCGTKWICIASTKPCVESVNRPNTVLDMLPGTEVTLLSESQVWKINPSDYFSSNYGLIVQ